MDFQTILDSAGSVAMAGAGGLTGSVLFMRYMSRTWHTEKKDSAIDLGNLGNYLPMNASDGLLTSPFERFTNMAGRLLPTDYNWIVLSFALSYLVLFYFWSRRKMLRSDL